MDPEDREKILQEMSAYGFPTAFTSKPAKAAKLTKKVTKDAEDKKNHTKSKTKRKNKIKANDHQVTCYGFSRQELINQYSCLVFDQYTGDITSEALRKGVANVRPELQEENIDSPHSPALSPTQPDSEAIQEPKKTNFMEKYYRLRYELFSRFNEGIQIDHEGWFSVTPERIAAHTASQIGDCGLILDAFLGVGGNAIQFALAGWHVVGVEMDNGRCKISRNNLKVYGVDDWVDVICGDSLQMGKWWRRPSRIKNATTNCKYAAAADDDKEAIKPFDIIFSSPPWGGPSYLKSSIYSASKMLPLSFDRLQRFVQTFSDRIIWYMPRQTDLIDLLRVCGEESPPSSNQTQNENIWIEQHWWNDVLKVLMIWIDSSQSLFC